MYRHMYEYGLGGSIEVGSCRTNQNGAATGPAVHLYNTLVQARVHVLLLVLMCACLYDVCILGGPKEKSKTFCAQSHPMVWYM